MKTKKGDYSKGEIEIIEEIAVFSNRYATLYNDQVRFPDASCGRYLRFCWNAPYGVILIPMNNDERLLLIKNFRHENRQWQWELPKGFGEAELEPKVCAEKELKEETGLSGQSWTLLHTLNVSGCPTYVYRVNVDFTRVEKSAPENSEAIATMGFFTKDECNELVALEAIHDPMTLYAVALMG